MEGREEGRQAGVLVLTGYLVLAIFIFTEQWGRTTSDTRLDLTNAPGAFLRDTFSLWNPRVSLGELQNQAYGYLFPQGSFFALFDGAHVPAWVTQRLWSVLVLVAACEVLRRVARAVGMGPWGAALAGFCYGLTPRHIAELGVRSAEILPASVLPWALLPILHAVDKRLEARAAALLSAAAFAFAGGVNGTATAAPAALLVVFVLWGRLSGRLSWSFVGWWGGLMVAVSFWWVLSLLRLGVYSPPFYDYVEDARATTSTSGYSSALRGASNWVDTIVVNGARWWPAGWDVTFQPWVVAATGVLSALGAVGLVRYRGRYRVPLLASAALGLTCLSVAHVAPLDGPVSELFRDLLDGPLAPLRNIAKADPILRIPLALGLGLLAEELVRAARSTAPQWWRRAGARVALAATVAGLVGAAWPVAAGHLRTPGWAEVPSYWTSTAAFLDEREGNGAAWVVPGSGFGIQTWGWTMEEPMQVLGTSSWVTRSQVPLTPAPTIRMLSAMETYLETGAGSPYLRNMLDRVGIDHVVVRHDLDPVTSLATPSSLVALALARSPGIERVATFGRAGLALAIEVFEVQNAFGGSPAESLPFDVRDVADTVTVASSVEDAIVAVGAGQVGDDQAMVVRGDTGWEEQVDIQGDQFRRRERSFGRVHEAESNVMAADDAYRAGRVVPNYPGPKGAQPVVARYDEIAGVTASSSAGYADLVGPVFPEAAPWAALDGDPGTYWRPAPFTKPEDEWIEVDLGAEQVLTEVRLMEPRAPLGLQPVTSWRVLAGDADVTVDADQGRAETVIDLGGARADRLRIEVGSTDDPQAPVGLAEIEIAGVSPRRTLVVPPTPLTPRADFVFGAAPESRACVPTLLGPHCDLTQQRPSEESGGIDRTIEVPATGTWRFAGLVVARSRPGTLELLRPQPGVQVTASSWLAEDPTVSARMAHDRDRTTSWIADPRDPEPTLRFELPFRRVLHRIEISRPADVARSPTEATIRAHGEERVVDLTGSGEFAPLTARRFTVTFRSSDESAFTLGVSEVRLRTGWVKESLDGATRTGAVCGFGPPLVVDGVTYDTRVTGPLGAVTSAGQLAVRMCDGPLRLSAGQRRVELRSTEQFQPVSLVLTDAGPRSDVARSRLLRVTSTSDTRHELEVGPGEEAILSTAQNFNEGWVARLDGVELEPVQVDGWAQGWLIPADAAGEVVMEFAPQRDYLLTLVAGLVMLGLVLLWAGWTVVRSRVGPPAPERLGSTAPSRSRKWAFGARGLAVLLAYVVGGVVVAAAATLGVVLAGRTRLVTALVGLTLLGALLALVIDLNRAPGIPTDTIDLVTGAGLFLGLVAALFAPRAGTEER